MGTAVYPPPLARLIASLSRLPGLGEKTATRLALHILRRPQAEVAELARTLTDVKEKIRSCSVCFNLTEADPCPLCENHSRESGILCVVEGPGDLLALEKAGGLKGKYHVLQGTLSPIDGVGPKDLRIRELLERLEKEKISEIVLAINPTTEGEATVSFLVEQIKTRRPEIRLTRIAYGIPMGGDLKYMDNWTIKMALDSRRDA
ncbi:MAG: recombination protein RecR [Deltaproteobacteria bacterium RBG_13_43_22]|nr:MAG: recombination protein RecR [Deltaproteobacteria bacterium RBG_13_43_22]